MGRRGGGFPSSSDLAHIVVHKVLTKRHLSKTLTLCTGKPFLESTTNYLAQDVILLQAQFSDDGTSITVRFSAEGSAAVGLLDADNSTSGSGPGACTSILGASSLQSLGDGATCEGLSVGILNLARRYFGRGAVRTTICALRDL